MKAQTFFADPAIDKLMSAFLALSAELHITRSQHRALVGVLVQRGIVSQSDIETWQPSPEEREVIDRDTTRLVDSLFQPFQASP